MSDLGEVLASLGLEQYYDALISEGFDTWETVQDVTENDLDALNFKLGHRRKLQRYIASQRGINLDQPLTSPYPEGSGERGTDERLSTTGDGQGERSASTTETKRKYRRHPKPDENAPERPPSAYVLFSNAIREEIKGQDLSFTDIAKLVGQRWQSLSTAEREPYESRAASLKESFNHSLAEYKKSEQFREYSQYLADFKAKHGGGLADNKRPKLEESISGGSGGSPTIPTVSGTRSPELGELSHRGSDGRSERSGMEAMTITGWKGPGSPITSAPLDSRSYHGTPRMDPTPLQTSRMTDPGRTPMPQVREQTGYFDQPRRPNVPGTASAQSGSAIARTAAKPPLSHADTAVSSVSSVPSTLSYGSGSTASIRTPLTPRDEQWGPSTPWEVPRPVHPPFSSPHGSSHSGLQPLKMPDRGFAHPADPNLRLPPPSGTPSSGSHDVHPLSMRAPTRPPPHFSDHRPSIGSRGEHGYGSMRAESGGEAHSSPLDLLARAVDAQRENRDRHQP